MPSPSLHLSWSEVACWNRLGREWRGHAPGELIEAYPAEWRADRIVALAATFEAIRQAAGHAAIVVTSAYRTPAYNAAVGGARASQHTQGRALDLRHSKLSAAELHALIRHMLRAGELPQLGGLGLYDSFVHVDVRARRNGRPAFWFGAREGA